MRRNFTLTIIPIALLIIFTLTGCGSSTLSGDLTPYSNGDQSFSIQLPASNDKAWITNDEAAGDTLDITNKDGNINIKVQCLSKGQAGNVATDLASYAEYAQTAVLSGAYEDMKLKDATADLPDFITDSEVQSFTLKNSDTSYKGLLAFMESDKCYYTYLILAVDEAYSNNKSKLLATIGSLEEITAVPVTETTDEEE